MLFLSRVVEIGVRGGSSSETRPGHLHDSCMMLDYGRIEGQPIAVLSESCGGMLPPPWPAGQGTTRSLDDGWGWGVPLRTLGHLGPNPQARGTYVPA